jgi:NhaA family Na+:H+ antiporter
LLKHRIRKSAVRIGSSVSNLIALLLRDEAISGKFLLVAAVAAIIIANSPLWDRYNAFWMHHFAISFGNLGISETFKHWINEGLMALFFLVISLEIKREIAHGELRHARMAALPIVAAIGGAVVPIALYLAFNAGHAGNNGWGVPMTTDTAFSIGLLALLGKRVPLPLKVFLLTATVVDDVAAITAIAVFYNQGIHLVPLLIAFVLLACIVALHWIRLLRMTAYVVLGIGMWFAIHASGIQASIAGVI